MSGIWIGVAILAGMAICLAVQVVGECRRSRRAGWTPAKRMLLSEILLRLGRGEVLRIYLFKPNGELPLGLRLEADILKLTEGPELPEPRRTTYPIGWERLVELLMRHIHCDRKHPLGVRRHEFAEEAKVLMLAMPGEGLALSGRLDWAWAVVHEREQKYLAVQQA